MIGHIGQKPEMIKTVDITEARFSLAVSNSYQQEKNRVTETQWFNMIANNALARIVEEKAKRGSQVLIEGRLNNRSYITDDGIKRYNTEVVVSDIKFFDAQL